MQPQTRENPLGTEPIRKLLPSFALPSILAMLVNALYNIVDQIFIGNSVGYLGNAATNVCFPLVTLSMALGLMFAQGGASKQNLELGAGNRPAAEKAVGNTIALVSLTGIVLLAFTLLFLQPMLVFFGATPDVLPYAIEYGSITQWGLPFVILSMSLSHSIRADGSPIYSMLCTVVGAVINLIMDPVLMFGFNLGVAGAAWATIAGQIVGCIVAVCYIPRYKHLHLHRDSFRLSGRLCLRLCALGIASFCNQITSTVVQIVLNNVVTLYGAASVYGSDIPLACMGIVMKLSMVFFSIVIGIAQGSGPIVSFNYGARKFDRVRETYKLALLFGSIMAFCGFLVFQLFPHELLRLFGDGSELYFAFGEKACRVYLFGTFLAAAQPITSTFFTSIGKAFKGTFVSLTRQFICLIPLILLLPALFGVEGVLYSQPVADLIAFAVAILLVVVEFRKMKAAEAAAQTQSVPPIVS